MQVCEDNKLVQGNAIGSSLLGRSCVNAQGALQRLRIGRRTMAEKKGVRNELSPGRVALEVVEALAAQEDGHAFASSNADQFCKWLAFFALVQVIVCLVDGNYPT